MGKIYKTQRIEIVLSYLEADAPPVTADSFDIKYKKPNGECGLYPATIDRNAMTISHIGANTSSYGVDGLWMFWSIANMPGVESPYESEPVSVYIYDNCC